MKYLNNNHKKTQTITNCQLMLHSSIEYISSESKAIHYSPSTWMLYCKNPGLLCCVGLLNTKQ